MDRKMVLDRIPRQFCEGPFWGNGKMGAVLYVQDGKLCISVDHVGLWELRETLPDEPKAVFSEILKHKKEYLEGDPAYVEQTDIFEEHIGRTKLPALAMELQLPGSITGFRAETDLEKAETFLSLEMEGDRKAEGRIYLDSCVNILMIELQGEGANSLEVKALGWDLDSPRLRPLKNWNYEPCIQTEKEGCFVVRQHFGGDRSAVLNAAGQAFKEAGKEGLRLAVSIRTGTQAEEETMAEEGSALVLDYLARTEVFLEAHRGDWEKFWSGFDIRVPNERLQEAFWQEMFKLYCNEREDSSPVTLQGVWNPNHRMPAWFGDLHNDLNVQSCYWPAYKTGNVNLVRPYIDYYSAASQRFMERTWKLFGIRDAIHIPTMKTLEPKRAETKAEKAAVNGSAEAATVSAPSVQIDLSKVKIEPLFADDVDFETFSKSDFRVVKIEACEAVPKSKKLLKFTLNDGTDRKRTILSGIHEYYEPEELVGKTCVAITNLPPRKMMGIDSEGMLISAVYEYDGREGLNLLMLDDSIPAGAKLY